MLNRKWAISALLVLVMSFGLALSAGATGSTGTMEVNCAGARFQGTVAVGETVQLDVRLHQSGALSPKIQDDKILLPEGPYDVFVPWVADPDGRFYRTAIRVNGAVIIVDEGTLDCQPAIDIEKATNGQDADNPTGPIVPVGDPVMWDYVITNTGNEVLVNLTVTDDILGQVCTFAGPLAVGDSFSCSAAGTAVAGQYANLGTVDGFGELSGDPVTDTDPSHYFGEAPTNPAIDIEKATNGQDADSPTGPFVPVGDPVVWDYVVTNTGNEVLVNLSVTDDILGQVCTFAGPLAVGDSFSCSATGTAMAGQYANLGTVDGFGELSGDPVTDSDPSHYFGEVPANPAIDIEKFTLVVPPPGGGGDLCDSFGKPQLLTMVYTGDNIIDHSQDSGKVSVTGNPNFASPVQIIASEKSDGTGKIYFNGTVSLGGSFVIDATLPGDSELRSNTWVLVKGTGGSLLSTINFHTSCSQPLELGDQFGSIQLVGFADKNGNGDTLPPPSTGFGDDADTPTGPMAVVGDTIQWTYQVTNIGDVALDNVMVSDDILGAITNIVDQGDGDGILDIGEVWIYQATGTATQVGQYANLGSVTGDSTTDGSQVSDSDPSHYIADFPPGDLCDAFGKPQLLTIVYTGDNVIDHSQDSGKVSVTGNPNFASPVQIIASEKDDGSGKIYFNGTVSLGGSFVIDATLPGDNELRSKTFVLVKDAGGNLLSTIEFHTSCSQPLELGDQFGSIQLVGFVDKNGNGLP